MKTNTKEICLKGLMIALVTVSTMVFQIPVSATNGYIHLGDGMIFLISVFFGCRYGMVAGGVGSAIADILTGYAHWSIFSLLIKGAMGYIVGKLSEGVKENNSFFKVKNIIAPIMGSVWMVFGYFIAGGILKSSFVVALTSIPENIVQCIGGIVIYLVVGLAFHKAKIYRYISVSK